MFLVGFYFLMLNIEYYYLRLFFRDKKRTLKKRTNAAIQEMEEGSTTWANIKGVNISEHGSFIDKVFLLITDSWFFSWLKGSESVKIFKKNKLKPKMILNDQLTKASVSYMSNNTKYIGNYTKKFVC